jgi:hypothetical protein
MTLGSSANEYALIGFSMPPLYMFHVKHSGTVREGGGEREHVLLYCSNRVKIDERRMHV